MVHPPWGEETWWKGRDDLRTCACNIIPVRTTYVHVKLMHIGMDLGGIYPHKVNFQIFYALHMNRKNATCLYFEYYVTVPT